MKHQDIDHTGLTGVGGTPSFRGARANRSATQAITTATWTDVSFTAADTFDTNALHDPAGANPERITLNAVGYWLVSLNVGWAASATGDRYIAIAPNGSRIMHVQEKATASAHYMNTQEIVQATAITDYVEAHVYQDSGGNLNVAAANMSVAFLGT